MSESCPCSQNFLLVEHSNRVHSATPSEISESFQSDPVYPLQPRHSSLHATKRSVLANQGRCLVLSLETSAEPRRMSKALDERLPHQSTSDLREDPNHTEAEPDLILAPQNSGGEHGKAIAHICPISGFRGTWQALDDNLAPCC